MGSSCICVLYQSQLQGLYKSCESSMSSTLVVHLQVDQGIAFSSAVCHSHERYTSLQRSSPILFGRIFCRRDAWLKHSSSRPDVVVSGLAHLPDPLVYLVAALLPHLEVLHPQPRRAIHWHLHIMIKRTSLPQSVKQRSRMTCIYEVTLHTQVLAKAPEMHPQSCKSNLVRLSLSLELVCCKEGSTPGRSWRWGACSRTSSPWWSLSAPRPTPGSALSLL